MKFGTVIRASLGPAGEILRLAPHGFATWQLAWSLKRDTIPRLAAVAKAVRPVLEQTGTAVSALGIYGNPLRTDEVGRESRRALREAFRTARAFGTDVVGCFAGRVPGMSVDGCVPRFRKVWSTLARQAADCGVRVAFENCLQGGTWERGDWNMAHNPAAWELMFDAVPDACLGLEWEPAHQMCQGINPTCALTQWAPRIWHVHGKDAHIDRAVLARCGYYGGERFAWHRIPGCGDSDWTGILRSLALAGFTGSVDVEGFHDPVYKDDRETEGQILALRHLQRCHRRMLRK